MLIHTTDFGDIDVPEENIIDFPDGIYGFEKTKRFAYIKQNYETGNLMWLQAVDSAEPCFVIFDPNEFVNDFDPIIPEADLKALNGDNPGDLVFFVIAVIPKDVKNTTVNYKSPIVINRSRNTGRQVILENPNYPFKFYVFDDGEGDKDPREAQNRSDAQRDA